jgi:dipeptidyl-peptidase-4
MQRPHERRGELSTHDVASYPLPGCNTPTQYQFSPDDRFITYLRPTDTSVSNHLYAFDPSTGQEVPVVRHPDRLGPGGQPDLQRRERQRAAEVGVVSYSWAHSCARLLVPLNGGIYVQDGVDPPLRCLVAEGGVPIVDPQISPCGNWVAYVQSSEVHVVSARPEVQPEPRQITFGAWEAGWVHGMAEFIAQEEMDREHGLWWSPCGQFLAVTEVDESHIPVYHILHQGKDGVTEDMMEDLRYPFAGSPNAVVRLGVVSVFGGDVVWMHLGPDVEYVARVKWADSGALLVVVQNRAQTQVKLLQCDPRTGRHHVLLDERNTPWINLHNLLRPLRHSKGEAEGGFLWGSERTGFLHLYLHDRRGRLVRALTQGDWVVDALLGVDEGAETAYFLCNKDDPTQQHLYAVSLRGGALRCLTDKPGVHSVTLDVGLRRFIDVHSDLYSSPTSTLRSLLDGSLICALPCPADPRLSSLPLSPPELVTLPAVDGTTLYGAVYRPDPDVHGPGPYPTMVCVYGGPGVQSVLRSWTATVSMRAQFLRAKGYLVFKLDNRGSACRGLAFESRIARRLGHVEIQDQVTGVNWLVARNLTDPRRVGMYGWSYGGYLSILALCLAPEHFQLAIAGAPVTSWDGYDTHYTERYMGSPPDNAGGYEQSSVLTHLDKMSGSLLLIHGLIDENVHFRHTTRLINALVAARQPYDLLLFPDERHVPRRQADRIYMEDRIFAYISQNL